MIYLFIEIAIYMLIANLLFSRRTVLSGQKNGCFYHKTDEILPPFLKEKIENIHLIETPAWFLQSGAAFILALGFQRIANYTLVWWEIFIQFAIAFLFMAGQYQMPSYHFQRGITAGLKDDDHLDNINESEVATRWFQFWKPRFFNNRRRKLAQWFGVFWTIAAIALTIWFNFIRD